MLEYKILRKIAVLGYRVVGKEMRTLELNIVQWNRYQPKYDIRTWMRTQTGERFNGGMTMTTNEMDALLEYFSPVITNRQREVLSATIAGTGCKTIFCLADGGCYISEKRDEKKAVREKHLTLSKEELKILLKAYADFKK